MWGDRRHRAIWNKQAGVVTEPEVLVESPKKITREDMWLKPALGGVVVKCTHPNCYWDWYSPIGGIRVGFILSAAEEHITKKHS